MERKHESQEDIFRGKMSRNCRQIPVDSEVEGCQDAPEFQTRVPERIDMAQEMREAN